MQTSTLCLSSKVKTKYQWDIKKDGTFDFNVEKINLEIAGPQPLSTAVCTFYPVRLPGQQSLPGPQETASTPPPHC